MKPNLTQAAAELQRLLDSAASGEEMVAAGGQLVKDIAVALAPHHISIEMLLRASTSYTPSWTTPPVAPQPRRMLMYFDGGNPKNGDPCYGSHAIFMVEADGKYHDDCRAADRVKRHEFSADLSSNEAEYLTLIAALKDEIQSIEALGRSPADWHLDIKGDSKLVVEQVSGRWKVKAAHLQQYTDQARSLLARFGSHTLTWHERANSVRVLGHLGAGVDADARADLPPAEWKVWLNRRGGATSAPQHIRRSVMKAKVALWLLPIALGLLAVAFAAGPALHAASTALSQVAGALK